MLVPDALFLASLQTAAFSPAVAAVVIVLATFVLEDVATVAAGVLAADGILPIPLALISLAAGVVLGDLGLYGIGRLAVSHPWLARFVEHERVAPLKRFLHDALVPTVLTARLPVLRLPTYLACGFFGVPFPRFAALVALAVAVWTPALFFASYLFGVYTLEWLGAWRWPIAFVAIGVLFLVGRFSFERVIEEGERAL